MLYDFSFYKLITDTGSTERKLFSLGTYVNSVPFFDFCEDTLYFFTFWCHTFACNIGPIGASKSVAGKKKKKALTTNLGHDEAALKIQTRKYRRCL